MRVHREREWCAQWLGWPLIALLLLAACGPTARWDHKPREQHVVRGGETLYAIAWRYDKDPKDLARWNKLGDGSLIFPGQVIRLIPPVGAATGRPKKVRTPVGSKFSA